MDAGACAAANVATWHDRAATALSDSGCDPAFADACAASRAGTDISAAKMAYVLAERRLDPTLTFHASSIGDDAAWTKVYEDPPWGPPRRAIEEALDVLGRGPIEDGYGEMRIVYEATDDVFVLPHNSATTYASPSGNLDEGSLCDDLALWASRGDVAVAERADVAATAPVEDWADIVGDEVDDRDLIEAVGAGPIDEQAIDVIRIRGEVLDSATADLFTALAREVETEELPAVVAQILIDPLAAKVERVA